jgi:hypothetical protein
MNPRNPGHSNSERYLCASAALRERNIDPRLGEMASSDKNDIFHAIDPQTKVLSESHTVIDVIDYPFTEIAVSDRVLALCGNGKRYQSAFGSRTRECDRCVIIRSNQE